jgi:hypothetical protein
MFALAHVSVIMRKSGTTRIRARKFPLRPFARNFIEPSQHIPVFFIRKEKSGSPARGFFVGVMLVPH